MKLTIIVPVYNVEAFLNKCIDSLLDQDFSSAEYEIILVDDGSTDASVQICDEYAEAHDNVRVVHQINGGLSAARNTGIRMAKGEYVQFVDSDDYLNAQVLRRIIEFAQSENLDILRINYQNVDAAGRIFEPNKYSKPFVDYSEEVCDGLTFLNERLGFACYAVQFVVRTTLLQQEGNGFKEGILFEDLEWAPRILLQAARVASSKTMVYNYLFRKGSITRGVDLGKKEKVVNNKLYLVGLLKQRGKSVSDGRWFDGMVAQTVLSIISEVSQCFYPARKQYVDELDRLIVFPISSFHATGPARVKIMIANLSPMLLCFFLHLKQMLK